MLQKPTVLAKRTIWGYLFDPAIPPIVSAIYNKRRVPLVQRRAAHGSDLRISQFFEQFGAFERVVFYDEARVAKAFVCALCRDFDVLKGASQPQEQKSNGGDIWTPMESWRSPD